MYLSKNNVKEGKVTALQKQKTLTWYNVRFSIVMAAIAFLTMLSSCARKPVADTQYINIDSILQAQKKILSASPTLLSREIRLDDKIIRDSSKNLDSVGWSTELDEFSRLATINKPTYKGTFAIEDGLRDANSNLKVKAFINTERLPIQYVKLYYLDHPFKLRKIESLYAEGENNLLYKNSRLFVLEFRDIYNKTMLSSYFIKGGQKILAGDTIEFAIRGTITIE